MADETEKEKPKFVCKLCKLDYPSSVQFEEHLWSMLHHKAINNKASSTTKHHCNLCMFESYDLNAYGKHLISEQHKRSLAERRKRLEDPRQVKPTTSATSCARRSESQPEHRINQTIKTSHSSTATQSIPSRFQHGVHSENQGVYSHNQRGYSHNQGGYPHNQGGYSHNQEVHSLNQGGYPRNQGGYSPNQGGYPPNHGGYPHNREVYSPNGEGYSRNQGGYSQNQGMYSQNQAVYAHHQGPNTFPRPTMGNNYFQGEFRHNSVNWQQPRNSFSWRPPISRFKQPNIGSRGNSFIPTCNQRQRFPTPIPAVEQQCEHSLGNKSHEYNSIQKIPTSAPALEQQKEKSSKKPVNPKMQKKVQNIPGKYKAHLKKTTVTSTVKIRKATEHSVASRGLSIQSKGNKNKAQVIKDNTAPSSMNNRKEKLCAESQGSSAQGSQFQKATHQLVPREQAHSDSVRKEGQSKTVICVKGTKGPTPSKAQRLKNEQRPSPYRKPNKSKTKKLKRRFVKKISYRNSLKNIPSAASCQSLMKQADKESQSPSTPTQSSEVASTRHSTPSKDNIVSTRTVQNATSASDRFEKNLQKALHGKFEVHGDDTVEVTSSNGVSISRKAANHSATHLTPTSSKVSSSEAVPPSQALCEQNKQLENTSSGPPAHSSSAANKETSKIHPQTERLASSDGASISERATRHPETLPMSSSLIVSSLAPVSSFHLLPEQSGKGSAEIRCASSTDELAPKIQRQMESSTAGTQVQDGSSPTAENTSEQKERVGEKCGETAADEFASKIQSCMKSSTKGTHVHNILLISSSETKDNSSREKVFKNKGREAMTNLPNTHVPKILSHVEGTCTSTYVQEIRPNPESSSMHKEQVKDTSEEAVSDEASTKASTLARSSSAPATLPDGNSQSKEPSTGNKPLLSKVLVNEQQKQKLNPRPNLTNARSRLRTNKDPEHPPGGQIFKEKIQGLLSDVAKPTWQQKKLHMMLAKAKKAPDRFNRFGHLASSPSRSEDSLESLDIMNLSTDFQQELLALIQSEDADEEDVLSQLTAPEVRVRRDSSEQELGSGNTLAESSKTYAEGFFGDIQEAFPQTSRDFHKNPSQFTTSATPQSRQKLGHQEAICPSHSASSRSTTPIVKLEPPDTSELVTTHAFDPCVGLHEWQSHSAQSNRKTLHDMANERESLDRQQHVVTSATPVIKQECLTHTNVDIHRLQPDVWNEGQYQQNVSSTTKDKEQGDGGSFERHDRSVTSTSAISPSAVIGSTDEAVEIEKAHKKKKKKKKGKKSRSKDKDSSSVKNTLPQGRTSKLKTSKRANFRRKSVDSSISGRVNRRTKSPTVLTANKMKKKFTQKSKKLDTVAGDMSSLLDITLQESKLQAQMDKLDAKMDKIKIIIEEQEAILKSFKQEKEKLISNLADLRDKRFSLLGLTSSEKTTKSTSSVNRRNGSSAENGPSSSNQSRLSYGGGASLRTDPRQADMSNTACEAVQSGGESEIRISNVTSLTQTTPTHRTEGFRIMIGSPLRPELDCADGTMDTHGDVGCNQDGFGNNAGKPPKSYIGQQSNLAQSVEVVPQVMSRESLAKTLQELNSCGSGLKVDILSEEETLYEPLIDKESLSSSSDVIGAVAKLVTASILSPDRDSEAESVGLSVMSGVTVEPYAYSLDSDQGPVRKERTGKCGPQGLLHSDTEEGSSAMESPRMKLRSSKTSLRKIKQEPQGDYDISQGKETLDHEEPSSAKRKQWKEVSEVTQAKRPKHNPKESVFPQIKQEPDGLLKTRSSVFLREQVKTLISQTEAHANSHQVNITSTAYPSGSEDNIHDHPSETLDGLKKSVQASTPEQNTWHVEDESPQEKTASASRAHSKGYVINMFIILDKLYACISDSRFIIFNLTTNKIDAEEDLALGNIEHFQLWRDTTGRHMVEFAKDGSRKLVQFDVMTNKIDAEEDLALGNIKHFQLWRDATKRQMVAFASDGSRKLVQFDVMGKMFLQTSILSKEITCLHVRWNNLYAGLVNGDIASINVQKSKVSWYYACTPDFAITAIASALEGGMGLLITASEDQTVTIRRADDGLLLRSLDGHIDVVTQLQVSGCSVMSMARNNTILIHNLETGHVIRRVKHQTKMACCVMSGDILAVAGHAGNVYYYKIKTGQVDIFDSGCGNITCMTASQDMLFLGIRDGFIDVIPLYPSTVYQCEWSHCISRFLRVDALKTHLKHNHIRRSARQCLWKSCLKNYPQTNTTLKVIEQHVFSHLKDLGK